jgi:hypothetical protein
MNAQTQGQAAQGQVAKLIGVLLLIAVFFLPALINRQPVLYPDSVGYFHSGYAAAKQIKATLDVRIRGRAPSAAPVLSRQQRDGITTARSVYYGLAFVAAYWLKGVWAMAAAQIALAMACLMLAARRAAMPERWLWWTCVLGIALFTGLNFFAVTIMPDLFAGLMLAAGAMLLAHGRRLPRWEYAFWLLIVVVAGLFHKAHLAILAVCLVAALGFASAWRNRVREWLWLAAAALMALAGHYAVDLTVLHVTGRPPIATPFALARLVGDGTAEKYLAEACPTRHFTTCDYLNRMPMRENDFLWSRDPEKSVMSTASRQTREAIAAESDAIVWGTLQAYPLSELKAALGNAVAQFATVGVTEFALVPHDDVAPIPMLRWALDHYQTTAIAEGRMPLAAISLMMRLVYFAALTGVAVLLWRLRRRQGDETAFAAMLVVGILANAVVSGVISGVFDRYQGRVVWLAALALLVLAGQWRRARNGEARQVDMVRAG